MQRVTILAGSSQSLISDSGDSEFYHQRQRRMACADLAADLHARREQERRQAERKLRQEKR
jgi:hypothetical protein